jgi:hypothetical protein
MNIRTEEEAVAVYTSILGSELPEGSHVVARCLVDGGGVLPDDGCICTVGIKRDNKDSVRLGGSHNYLGPDGKVWTFPSSEKWSRLVDEIPTDYAATSSSCSSVRSAITPLSNLTPARTSATRCGALTIRHRLWADSISL